MKCALCNKDIARYDARLHRLKIDESREVDICTSCIDRIVDWQGKIISTLFPTKALKRRFEKD